MMLLNYSSEIINFFGGSIEILGSEAPPPAILFSPIGTENRQ